MLTLTMMFVMMTGMTVSAAEIPGIGRTNCVSQMAGKKTSTSKNLIFDGRDYSPVFDAQYYLGRYEDLRNAYGSDEAMAFRHFLKSGMKEGRRASEFFDVKFYKNRYPDLQLAFGDDYVRYFHHYLDYGIRENRKGSDSSTSGQGGGQTEPGDIGEYGELAYQLVQEIDANFPYRINNKAITTDQTTLRAMGQWINDRLASYGYQPVIYRNVISDHELVDYACRKQGISGKRIVIGAHYDSQNTRGCEDNGTGVALVLELAKRFSGKTTPLTLEFCFFDGEEYRGFGGSYSYLAQSGDYSDILLYINIDSIGTGDFMFAYGGIYDDAGKLTKDWGLQMTFALADELGVDLHVLPESVKRFKTPTRDSSSDHYYFLQNGIPYVYFEANAWIYKDGSVRDEQRPHYLNSLNPAFADTEGQIIHTKYDDFHLLEALLPGVMRKRLGEYSRLVTAFLTRADTTSSVNYAGRLSPDELIRRFSPLSKGSEEPPAPEPEAPSHEELIRQMFTILGREPLEKEIEEYGRRLNSGESAVSALASLVFGNEAIARNLCTSCFIRALHQTILNRPVSDEGVTYFLNLIDRGMKREEIFNYLAEKDEFRERCTAEGLIAGTAITVPEFGTIAAGNCSVCGDECGAVKFARRLYTECLGRNAEAEGLEYWRSQLCGHNRSGTETAYNFFFVSAEFQRKNFDDEEFVRRLYRTMLGREPDEAGITGWVNGLANGMTRESVFYGFAGSEEFTRICNRYEIIR